MCLRTLKKNNICGVPSAIASWASRLLLLALSLNDLVSVRDRAELAAVGLPTPSDNCVSLALRARAEVICVVVVEDVPVDC